MYKWRTSVFAGERVRIGSDGHILVVRTQTKDSTAFIWNNHRVESYMFEYETDVMNIRVFFCRSQRWFFVIDDLCVCVFFSYE